MRQLLITNILYFIFRFGLGSGVVFSQSCDYYLGASRYSFIRYDANEILFPDKHTTFNALYDRMDSIMQGKQDQIRIVHIGGSHIQADMYTHVLRKRFQEMSADMKGSRGFIFPFRMAETNNPSNYLVEYTGEWTPCKCTRIIDECLLGLSGMAVTTADSTAILGIRIRNTPDYFSDFDSIRIFHEPADYTLLLVAGGDSLEGSYDSLGGYTSFSLNRFESAFQLQMTRLNDTARFHLLGISLDSDRPGVVYDAVGVNGARLSSYLRCERYEQHLKALDPDLIIFSIGTNDGYTRYFNEDLFYQEYSELLKRTLRSVPHAAILLTVPNDSYLYRRYANRNTAQIRKEIFRLAEKYHCGVWDFYTIMGGLNSARDWYSLDLMVYDRVHFTREGYSLKGELLFSAFLKAWEARLPETQEAEKNY